MSGDGLPSRVTAGNAPLFIEAARHGTNSAKDRLLESYRTYLRRVVRRSIGRDLRGKLDGSDIVQVTLIEAHRDFDQFDSSTHSALQRWLGRLLRNNLADALKRYRDTAMRDIGREIPIDSKIKELAQAEPAQLPSFDSLPERYRRALAKLSLERQTVIQLRHFEDLKFAEIGQRMGKTENAARMLYLRAVEALQSESSNDDSTREYS